MLLAVLLFASIAMGQTASLSYDEAVARLKIREAERLAHPATKSTTKPTTKPANSLDVTTLTPTLQLYLVSRQKQIDAVILNEHQQIKAFDDEIKRRRSATNARNSSTNRHGNEPDIAAGLPYEAAEIGGGIPISMMSIQQIEQQKIKHQQAIKQLQAHPETQVPNLPSTFKVGEVGKMSIPGMIGEMCVTRIVKVLNKSQLVIDWPCLRSGASSEFSVHIDESQRIMLSGFSTDGLVDDKSIEIAFPIVITGTTQREGSTIFNAEVLDLSPLKGR
jgi:hypothetical protein